MGEQEPHVGKLGQDTAERLDKGLDDVIFPRDAPAHVVFDSTPDRDFHCRVDHNRDVELAHLFEERFKLRVIDGDASQRSSDIDAFQPKLIDSPVQLVDGWLAVEQRNIRQRNEFPGVIVRSTSPGRH